MSASEQKTRIVGHMKFTIAAPHLLQGGRTEAERLLVQRRHLEKLGTAASVAAMRSSVAAYVSSAGFNANDGATIVVVVPNTWEPGWVDRVGVELTHLVYTEYGADQDTERAARSANDLPTFLWQNKWVEDKIAS